MFPKRINKAIELRKSGLSYAKIAVQVNADRKNVSYYLKEKGYGPNLKYVRQNQNQPNKKYVNENIFEIINTEEKAYWLVFMFADGCVNRTSDRIELSLKEDDHNHIQNFKSF